MKRDLCFLNTTTNNVVEVPFELTGDCDGRAALAQRVMTLLLRRTDDAARSVDTGILQEVGASNVRGTAELRNDFTLAINEVSQLIQTEQSTDTTLTDEETLRSVELEDIIVGEEDARVTINIITVAGEPLLISTEI